MTQESSDPVIDEIRDVRRQISARFGHDPTRLVAYYIKLQERHKDRLIERPQTPDRGDETAA